MVSINLCALIVTGDLKRWKYKMSKKLAKYIITTGSFDNETNNLKEARKALKAHAAEMKAKYNDRYNTYGLYMLVEKSK